MREDDEGLLEMDVEVAIGLVLSVFTTVVLASVGAFADEGPGLVAPSVGVVVLFYMFLDRALAERWPTP